MTKDSYTNYTKYDRNPTPHYFLTLLVGLLLKIHGVFRFGVPDFSRRLMFTLHKYLHQSQEYKQTVQLGQQKGMTLLGSYSAVWPYCPAT
jgi:hypothetical protein